MNETRASALILDGHLSSALAATRELQRRGVRVLVAATRRTALALHTRAASETYVYPDPKRDLPGYVEAVSRIAEQEHLRTGKPVVPYFFSDESFLPFARATAEQRSSFVWGYPSLEVIEAVFDKQATLQAAERVGLPVPNAFSLSTACALPVAEYPLILKPRHSCIWRANGQAVRGTAERAYSAEALAARWQALQAAGQETPLIQGCISGEEVGLFTVCQGGVAHGWFSHRRLLGIHPDGGASSVRLSVLPPPVLVEWSSRLLRALGWSGPAMVEWKYDQVAETYRLMEINGRWWGSLALTLAAGYPAVDEWYRLSTNHSVEAPSFASQSNVQAVHFLAVLKCTLSCLRKGRFHQAATALRLCLPSAGRKLIFDVESWRDPAPFFWELIDVVARMLVAH